MSEHGVRKPNGQVFITPEFGAVVERDTVCCVHCRKHWIVEPGSGRQRGWCMNCNGPTCGAETCAKRCVPYEKMIEQIEQKWARMQSRW